MKESTYSVFLVWVFHVEFCAPSSSQACHLYLVSQPSFLKIGPSALPAILSILHCVNGEPIYSQTSSAMATITMALAGG